MPSGSRGFELKVAAMIVGGGRLGVRFLIPSILMFRTDVATGEEGFSVRFFLGTKEKAVAQRERVR